MTQLLTCNDERARAERDTAPDRLSARSRGPIIGRDRLYGGIQITEPQLLLGP